jgi:CheY-like chemotaxis protein
VTLPSPSDPRRVLVVDDEPDLIATYVRLLERQGYRVVAAGTRGGALTIIEREPLRFVISDVRLPDGNGFDIIRAATARPRSTLAIVVTGFSSEDASRCVRVGRVRVLRQALRRAEAAPDGEGTPHRVMRRGQTSMKRSHRRAGLHENSRDEVRCSPRRAPGVLASRRGGGQQCESREHDSRGQSAEDLKKMWPEAQAEATRRRTS